LINAPNPLQNSSTFVRVWLLGATSLGNLLPVIATALISLGVIVVIYFYVQESHPSKAKAKALD
jgi:hypothetical protein